MTNLAEAKDYYFYDAKYASSFNRPCIDGTITGCGKCVAYCDYEGHPGFLNEALREKKECLKNECKYYVPKSRKTKKIKHGHNDEKTRVLAVASAATNDMEGLKIMRVSKDPDGTWVVYYVAVAEYALTETAQEINKQTGINVKFQQLEYCFDIATSIVFDM